MSTLIFVSGGFGGGGALETDHDVQRCLNTPNNFFNLRVAEWIIVVNFDGNFNDLPNQTAEAIVSLLLGTSKIPVRCNRCKFRSKIKS